MPGRPPGQPVEQHWSTPAVGAKVIPVWFLLEGAGVMAVCGYLLTAELVSAIATGLAIVTFWWYGPARY